MPATLTCSRHRRRLRRHRVPRRSLHRQVGRAVGAPLAHSYQRPLSRSCHSSRWRPTAARARRRDALEAIAARLATSFLAIARCASENDSARASRSAAMRSSGSAGSRGSPGCSIFKVITPMKASAAPAAVDATSGSGPASAPSGSSGTSQEVARHRGRHRTPRSPARVPAARTGLLRRNGRYAR
jgi:hypothetical protein